MPRGPSKQEAISREGLLAPSGLTQPGCVQRGSWRRLLSPCPWLHTQLSSGNMRAKAGRQVRSMRVGAGRGRILTHSAASSVRSPPSSGLQLSPDPGGSRKQHPASQCFVLIREDPCPRGGRSLRAQPVQEPASSLSTLTQVPRRVPAPPRGIALESPPQAQRPAPQGGLPEESGLEPQDEDCRESRPPMQWQRAPQHRRPGPGALGPQIHSLIRQAGSEAVHRLAARWPVSWPRGKLVIQPG